MSPDWQHDLLLDKVLSKRIQDVQLLAGEDKSHLFARMDAFLRDAKENRPMLINIHF